MLASWFEVLWEDCAKHQATESEPCRRSISKQGIGLQIDDVAFAVALQDITEPAIVYHFRLGPITYHSSGPFPKSRNCRLCLALPRCVLQIKALSAQAAACPHPDWMNSPGMSWINY